ncbi:MAG TPA: NigD-like N-terminal domain-containing protein [Draconibacterium sp.]|nr:NigD-like N-terminal domain-containing protein [Draconibacterium sp.]
MKRLICLFAVFAILFTACQNDDEIILEDVGMVVDYASAGNCGYIIELENGTKIQPLYYPEGFTFSQGQRVHIQYAELTNVVPSCDRGIPAEIVFVEELDCASFIDWNSSGSGSLPGDPISVHEAFIDGNCIQIKISYGGGCKEHTINLARIQPSETDTSSIPTFEISHNANGDMCEAYFTKELRFDLKPLKQEGIKTFVLTAKLTNGEIYKEIFELE